MPNKENSKNWKVLWILTWCITFKSYHHHHKTTSTITTRANALMQFTNFTKACSFSPTTYSELKIPFWGRGTIWTSTEIGVMFDQPPKFPSNSNHSSKKAWCTLNAVFAWVWIYFGFTKQVLAGSATLHGLYLTV